MKKLTFCFAFFLAGCQSINPIHPVKVKAQASDAVGGAIQAMAPGVYDVRIEAVWNSAGYIKLEFPFDVPPNSIVKKIQGLLSYNGNSQCWSQAYADMVFADVTQPAYGNPQFVIAAVKANSVGGGSFSTFVNYDVPLPYQSGHGKIFLANTQSCTGLATLEFDGVMQIQ
jgi:hypothetical protein